jgi:hypothetical protein
MLISRINNSNKYFRRQLKNKIKKAEKRIIKRRTQISKKVYKIHKNKK